MYANGEDRSPCAVYEHEEVKSIGNSTTAVRPKKTTAKFAQSSTCSPKASHKRLREKGLCGYNVQLSVRKYNLETYQRQKMLDTAVADSKSIFSTLPYLSAPITRANPSAASACACRRSCRSACRSVRCLKMPHAGKKAQKLETTVDFLRCKYGGDIIDRGIR